MNFTAERVEMIRQFVNGAYTGPDAFDPNEKIQDLLNRKHLDFIYLHHQ